MNMDNSNSIKNTIGNIEKKDIGKDYSLEE